VVNDHAIRSGRYVDQPVVHPATSRIQADSASVAGPVMWLPYSNTRCFVAYVMCVVAQYVILLNM
jgi:hypothetical protein